MINIFKSYIRSFLSNLILGIVNSLLQLMDNSMSRQFLCQLIKLFEKKLSAFIAYNETPKYVTMLNLSVFGGNGGKKMAVIMQGPLVVENNYTLETVRYYLKVFPDAKIIVSTWFDSDVPTIKELEKVGAIVVLNHYPLHSGIYNVNYQVISTYNGIKKAKELGLDYCIKTRSDQRLCRVDIASYLFGLLKAFPLQNTVIKGQKERIVFCQGSHPAHMLIPYEICDFFFFGHTDDLLSYFHFDISDEDWKRSDFDIKLKQDLERGVSAEDYHAKNAPEVLLLKNYLQRNGFDTEKGNAIDNYWSTIVNSFVPVSIDDLQLHWMKDVSNSNNSIFRNEYVEGSSTSIYNLTWTYRNWIALRSGTLSLPQEYKELSQKPLAESSLY